MMTGTITLMAIRQPMSIAELTNCCLEVAAAASRAISSLFEALEGALGLVLTLPIPRQYISYNRGAASFLRRLCKIIKRS